MTEDKITLTREQYESWAGKGGSYNFDSLKAFVEKPKWRKVRREFYLEPNKEPGAHDFHVTNVLYLSNGKPYIHVREAFPGDILKTKEEAREWVLDGFRKAGYVREDFSVAQETIKALGLAEGRSE